VIPKRDMIVVLTEVEKELALRSQYTSLDVVSNYKKIFVEDLIKGNTNPECPIHSVIFNIIMRLGEK